MSEGCTRVVGCLVGVYGGRDFGFLVGLFGFGASCGRGPVLCEPDPFDLVGGQSLLSSMRVSACVALGAGLGQGQGAG